MHDKQFSKAEIQAAQEASTHAGKTITPADMHSIVTHAGRLTTLESLDGYQEIAIDYMRGFYPEILRIAIKNRRVELEAMNNRLD